MTVLGPTLYVAGAFFDGSASVVEPLGQPHWMIMDYKGDRQIALAQLLNALDHGLQELLR